MYLSYSELHGDKLFEVLWLDNEPTSIMIGSKSTTSSIWLAVYVEKIDSPLEIESESI